MASPPHQPNIGPFQSGTLPHTHTDSARVPQQGQLSTDGGWRMLSRYSDLPRPAQVPGRPAPGPGPGPGPGLGRQRNSGNSTIQSPPRVQLPSQDRPEPVESGNTHEDQMEWLRRRLQRAVFQTENEDRLRGQTWRLEPSESGLAYLVYGTESPETERSRLAYIYQAPAVPAVRVVRVLYQTARDRKYSSRQRRINSLRTHQRIRQELWAQNLLQSIPACPDGDTWVRLGDGYGCSGFRHFVGDSSLASGDIEIRDERYQPSGSARMEREVSGLEGHIPVDEN